MIETTRRLFLGGLVLAGGTMPRRLVAENQRNVREDPIFLVPPYQLGIASGDPSADGFVIWTRLAPEPLQADGGMVMQPVRVRWEVSEDDRFQTIAAKGDAIAHPELAHSVHVEVAGLKPDRPYWYRFRCGREQSVAGRAMTLPLPGARKDRLRFAVAGCQHYEEGYFTAWRRIAEEPIDFVFHYGDYIYEDRDQGPAPRMRGGHVFTPVRRHLGDSPFSLGDYRRRYAQYKMDADLQAAHAAAPFFMSFDDHEVVNDWAGDTDRENTDPAIFLFRRAGAFQAYYEHMPLRRASMPSGNSMQMFRSARFGDLLDAYFLDTRQYRSPQAQNDRDSPINSEVLSPSRTMMGARQESWLFDGLRRSDSRWQLIAHQVMLMQLAQMREGAKEPIYSMDQWSGYLHARGRLVDFIGDNKLTNVMTVSGDAHRHFAGDILRNGGSGAPVTSEYLATSITSGGDGQVEPDGYQRSVEGNRCLQAIRNQRGYVICDVNRDIWRGDLKVLDSVRKPDGNLSTFKSFVTERGKPGLQLA